MTQILILPFVLLGLLVNSRVQAADLETLPWIRVNESGSGFVSEPGEKAFRLRGVNYDHNEQTGGLIEETFPLRSSIDELVQFIEQANAAGIADGWISFYWGKSAKEYAADDANFVSSLKGAWLERFKEIGPK